MNMNLDRFHEIHPFMAFCYSFFLFHTATYCATKCCETFSKSKCVCLKLLPNAFVAQNNKRGQI